MPTSHLSITQAADLLKQSGNLFTEVFKHGTLSVEFYKPEKTDNQTPHNRDEVYIIATGTGQFYNNGAITHFKPCDFLFVPVGIEHRFLNFTDDFSTWVLFYGPAGGEKEK
jgi:mannose-6-phosphate isomerase-like protein (cupin superfamily)